MVSDKQSASSSNSSTASSSNGDPKLGALPFKSASTGGAPISRARSHRNSLDCGFMARSIYQHNSARSSYSSSFAAAARPPHPLKLWPGTEGQTHDPLSSPVYSLYPLPPHLTPKSTPLSLSPDLDFEFEQDDTPFGPLPTSSTSSTQPPSRSSLTSTPPPPSSDPRSSSRPSSRLSHHSGPPRPRRLSQLTSVEESHAGVLESGTPFGVLTIKVVEARNLAVKTGTEKPYVLLQYDRTDSVSREFGALPRRDSVAGLTNSAKKKKKGFHAAVPSCKTGMEPSKTVTTVRRVGSMGKKEETDRGDVFVGETEAEQIARLNLNQGTVDAPVWNHVAQFDVVQRGRTILLCVYDKQLPPKGGNLPSNGFLGAFIFEPPLVSDPGLDEMGLDVWVPLESAFDPEVGGEVRLRILYETIESPPRIAVDDFQILKLIGQGSFGQVFKVRKRDTKRVYAMKVIKKDNVDNKHAVSQVLAERQVLAKTIDSPFLVGLKFSFQTTRDLFFVIDYKAGGELFAILQRDGGRFEESKVRFYMCEIILALDFLHSSGIIYRDLKPENCLLDGAGHCVLVDFGLSKVQKTSRKLTRTVCGTTAFIAPEVLLDVGYNYRADWWSLGVLLFEMCFGWSPFYAESKVDEYERILSMEIKIPAKKGCSPENRDLLLRLMERDPDKRLGAHEGAADVQAHAFFAEVDWQKVALRQIVPPFQPSVFADDDDYYLGESACGRKFSAAGGGGGGGGGGDEYADFGWARGEAPDLARKTTSEPDLSLDDDHNDLFRGFTFAAPQEFGGRRRSSWTGQP